MVNGWNGVGIAPDITGAKTFGVSLERHRCRPAPTSSRPATSARARRSPPDADTASPDTRILADLVVAHTMGALGLNLNFDYVKDECAGYNDTIAVSLMGRYAINDNFALAARGEYWSNAVAAARTASVRRRSPSASRSRWPAASSCAPRSAPTSSEDIFPDKRRQRRRRTGHRHRGGARLVLSSPRPEQSLIAPASPHGGAGVFFFGGQAAAIRPRCATSGAAHVVEHAGGGDRGAGARAGDHERVLAVADGREGDLVVGALEAEERAGAVRRSAARRRSGPC